MIRKEIPRLFPKSEPMEFGKVRRVAKGTDLTLLSTGICTEEAMRATKTLQERGLSIDHLHATTLKPFDDPAVVDSAANSKYGVITMENHNVLGGLATATAELLSLNGVGARITPIGLQDTYAHGASQQYLMKEYGLDAMSLVRRVEEVVGDSFDVTEKELAEARISEFAAEGQLEAL
jgi:transketolase